jgi:hypothetical protein
MHKFCNILLNFIVLVHWGFRGTKINSKHFCQNFLRKFYAIFLPEFFYASFTQFFARNFFTQVLRIIFTRIFYAIFLPGFFYASFMQFFCQKFPDLTSYILLRNKDAETIRFGFLLRAGFSQIFKLRSKIMKFAYASDDHLNLSITK